MNGAQEDGALVSGGLDDRVVNGGAISHDQAASPRRYRHLLHVGLFANDHDVAHDQPGGYGSNGECRDQGAVTKHGGGTVGEQLRVERALDQADAEVDLG